MSLYLYQNNQQTGPFSEGQITQMLQAGIVSPDTMAWKEGMAGWEPLSTFGLAGTASGMPPLAPPMPSPAKSPLGIISFGFSLVSVVGWIVLLAAAGMAHNAGTATETFNVIVGFLFLGGVALNFLAMVLGVVGAFKTKANTLAIIGAALNGFLLLALVVLLCIGLAAKNMHQVG